MRVELRPCWAAAALLLGAPSARADAPALRADPPALVLGAGARARLELDLGVEELPSVTASAGRIENLRALGEGRFAADYVPPAEPFPRVAVVAAIAGSLTAWTAIPLSGHGVAIARSAPGASIRVRIGDAWFGPVRGDPSGEARVPVVVPPGVDVAYHRDKPLPLDVPQTPHVHLALARASAPADAPHEVPLRAFAVTPGGAPRPAAPVAIGVTQGEVLGMSEVAPGEWAGTWRLPPGAAGEATAIARLADEPGVASVATLARPAGAPARLALAAARTRVEAGDREPIALRVAVTDAAGNPVATEPEVVAAPGGVSKLAPAGAGAWEGRLELPEPSLAARRVEVIARAATLEQRIAIDVAATPGPPPVAAPERADRGRRLSVAPKLGLAASSGSLRSASASVEGLWTPAVLGGRLGVAIEVGTFAYERSDRVALSAQTLAIEGRARYVPLTAAVRLQLAPAPRQVAWIGLGLGVAAVDSELRVASGAARTESGAVPVAELSTGWGLRAGRFTPFAEARAARLGDPEYDALRGTLDVLTLSIGCRYDAY